MTVKTWNRRVRVWFGSVTRKMVRDRRVSRCDKFSIAWEPGALSRPWPRRPDFTGRGTGDHGAEFCISARVMGNMAAIGRARPWGV